MLELIDYYVVLQVDPSAEPEVVRAAYRALAQKYHPDVDGGAAERMVAINRAWDVLCNPETRAMYDRSRAVMGPRRSPVAPVRPEPTAANPGAPVSNQGSGTVLDFGRYAGRSFSEIARTDPDFLRWLARMPIGRPYAAEIERILVATRPPEPVRQDERRGRFSRR
jgi:curved DNA-binding protein CbpA